MNTTTTTGTLLMGNSLELFYDFVEFRTSFQHKWFGNFYLRLNNSITAETLNSLRDKFLLYKISILPLQQLSEYEILVKLDKIADTDDKKLFPFFSWIEILKIEFTNRIYEDNETYIMDLERGSKKLKRLETMMMNIKFNMRKEISLIKAVVYFDTNEGKLFGLNISQ